ncbi:MAG: TspO/MBR family protein, partial [Patescibacteria group bacterium]
MSPFIRVVVAFIATFTAGAVGFLLIDTGSLGWYASLVKPALTPPDSIFSIVWSALYILMALSLSIVWTIRPQTASTEGWVRFYFVQLLFNVAWILFFFKLHAVLIALIDILVLGFIILALIAAGGG